MISLTTPISEETIRSLKVGDEVFISGTVFTGRDAVHKYLHEGGKLPPGVKFKDGILYHCGPVVMKDEQGNWKVHRRRPDHFHPRRTVSMAGDSRFRFARRDRQRRHGRQNARRPARNTAAFTSTASAARRRCWRNASRKCRNVHFLKEFGAPEAIWEFEVENFPAVVTMDSHGQSLHKEIFAASQAELAKYL